MVFVLTNDELPAQNYTPAKFKGSIAMMTVIPKGVIIMYTDLGENIFISWDEVIEYAATAKRESLPEPAPAEPEKKKVREVKPAQH